MLCYTRKQSMHWIDALKTDEDETQLFWDTEKQGNRSTSNISAGYHRPVIRSSLCLCRLAELHCGGGQIVTTGAPQQFSVSKWKPTPTPTHRFIPDLAQHFYYLSVRFFSLLSVSVHVSLYTLPPSDNNHADISWYFFRFWKSNAWIINLSLYQHIITQTITQIQLLMLLFEWNCCYSSVILWTLISPFICSVSVLVLL